MATVRKNQVKKVRFELTKSAIGGIAVIVFCLFLWMFLLGVWAGQSLLLPAYNKKATVVEEKIKVEPPVIKVEKKIMKKGE